MTSYENFVVVFGESLILSFLLGIQILYLTLSRSYKSIFNVIFMANLILVLIFPEVTTPILAVFSTIIAKVFFTKYLGDDFTKSLVGNYFKFGGIDIINLLSLVIGWSLGFVFARYVFEHFEHKEESENKPNITPAMYPSQNRYEYNYNDYGMNNAPNTNTPASNNEYNLPENSPGNYNYNKYGGY